MENYNEFLAVALTAIIALTVGFTSTAFALDSVEGKSDRKGEAILNGLERKQEVHVYADR